MYIYTYIYIYIKYYTIILIIIFWHFLIIFLRSESPQVKRYLISTITNLVQVLPHELPNDLRLTKLGNIRKMSNVGGDAA